MEAFLEDPVPTKRVQMQKSAGSAWTALYCFEMVCFGCLFVGLFLS